jgi:hypothetical protein
MSHPVFYGSIIKNLAFLEQMAHGSKPMVDYYQSNLNLSPDLGDYFSEFEYKHSEYEEFLKTSVSDYLIQCASKTRIIQDSNDFKADDPNDKESFDKYSGVATCIEGTVDLSIRECCNKIIHAKEVSLKFIDLDSGTAKYWNGVCVLKGDKYGNEWHIELDIKKWVLAMSLYHQKIG